MEDFEKEISMALRPKARVLRTLGEELISSETVAVIELVKNAYDADAKNVLVKFDGPLKNRTSCIEVYDDGHGMDLSVIKESWMIIATSTKKNKNTSKSGVRRVLGEKGIGRFASARLAHQLELITKVSEKDKEIYAFFDWSQFENDDLFLDQVTFLAEERSAKVINKETAFFKENNTDKPHGTLLKMELLKKDWEYKDFSELQRGLSRLISPFSNTSDFNIYLELPGEYQSFTSKIEPPEIIKYPHYTVEGAVDSKGYLTLKVIVNHTDQTVERAGRVIRKLDRGEWKYDLIQYTHDENALEKGLMPLECGPLTFEIRVWDRDSLENVVQKVGGGLISIRHDLDAIAGLNIYRDGFRVLPYGEPGNDWLKLDQKRVQNPTRKLSNNQITGYVSITSDENPKLHDRSNREGLDNNSAYTDLQGVMSLVLNETETVRYAAKRKNPDNNPSDKDKETVGLFETESLSTIVDSLGKNDHALTKDLIQKIEKSWNSRLKKLQSVLSQYHALATLGGIVDKVLHEGRQPLGSIQVEAGLAKESTDILQKEICDNPHIDEVAESLRKIKFQATILHDVFRRIEPFSGRKKGRPSKYYIEDVIRDNFLNYKKETEAANINIKIPNSQTLVSLDVTELSEIFTNLITNSIYWLSKVPKDRRAITVGVNRLDDSSLEIFFSDTGPGVDPLVRDSLFEPYVTTRTDGHGLGLSLVGEIVKSYYNGEVELIDAPVGTTFRILLKKRI